MAGRVGSSGGLAVLVVWLVSAPGGQTVAPTPFLALSRVPVPEMPAKAADLVQAAPILEREATAAAVLRAVTTMARPGVMPYVVSAICRRNPEVAGAVVAHRHSTATGRRTGFLPGRRVRGAGPGGAGGGFRLRSRAGFLCQCGDGRVRVPAGCRSFDSRRPDECAARPDALFGSGAAAGWHERFSHAHQTNRATGHGRFQSRKRKIAIKARRFQNPSRKQ